MEAKPGRSADDATVRKDLKADAALRESEARHRLLIESWAQAVWETDGAGVVVTDSPSWRAYTGQTLDEWLGYGWLDAIHPDDRAYAERPWREATAARGRVDAEFRLRAPDGGWRWTNVRAAAVFALDGAALDTGRPIRIEEAEPTLGLTFDLNIFALDRDRNRVAVLFTDVTARNKAAAALRENEERARPSCCG